MPQLPPMESFASILDAALPGPDQIRLRMARATIYAAVLRESVTAVLSPGRRRALLRRARSAGIDDFEAKLLISGAEYRAGIRRVNKRCVLRLVHPDE